MKQDSKICDATAMKPSKEVLQLVELFQQISAASDTPDKLLKEFRNQYTHLPQNERPVFFKAILCKIETRKSEIEDSLRALLDGEESDTFEWGTHLTKLRQEMESPRRKAFNQFVNLRGGIKFLLDLRGEVLQAQKHGSDELRLLDQDIAYLFNKWFQQGFLFLRQITQDSPFSQIQFLKEHELVHPMASVEEMGSRLGEDRLCFALFHQAMPGEMVIFIEVALTKGITRSIEDIIGTQPSKLAKADAADTAIFYSINNAQNGLAGLGFGKLLIFQVVDLIRDTRPQIETFATLSPIPGFWERYLKRILEGDDKRFAMKRKAVEELFPEKTRTALMKYHAEQTEMKAKDICDVLLDLFSGTVWIEDPRYVKWIEKPLTELVYFYIMKEKSKRGKPLNPVANFHLGNGAAITRANINFSANPSPRGMKESCGMMINYVYSTPWRRQLRRAVKSLLPWQT